MSVNESVSEQGTGSAVETTPEQAAAVSAPPFSRDELTQFNADDSHAATVIGKMLALFFIFLFSVMSYICWWTIKAIGE